MEFGGSGVGVGLYSSYILFIVFLFSLSFSLVFEYEFLKNFLHTELVYLLGQWCSFFSLEGFIIVLHFLVIWDLHIHLLAWGPTGFAPNRSHCSTCKHLSPSC